MCPTGKANERWLPADRRAWAACWRVLVVTQRRAWRSSARGRDARAGRRRTASPRRQRAGRCGRCDESRRGRAAGRHRAKCLGRARSVVQLRRPIDARHRADDVRRKISRPVGNQLSLGRAVHAGVCAGADRKPRPRRARGLAGEQSRRRLSRGVSGEQIPARRVGPATAHWNLAAGGPHVLLVCPGPIAREDATAADAGGRYAEQAGDIPASAQKPGGGAKVRAIDPRWLVRAESSMPANERRAELVVPRRRGCSSPSRSSRRALGDWLLRRMTCPLTVDGCKKKGPGWPCEWFANRVLEFGSEPLVAARRHPHRLARMAGIAVRATSVARPNPRHAPCRSAAAPTLPGDVKRAVSRDGHGSPYRGDSLLRFTAEKLCRRWRRGRKHWRRLTASRTTPFVARLCNALGVPNAHRAGHGTQMTVAGYRP